MKSEIIESGTVIGDITIVRCLGVINKRRTYQCLCSCGRTFTRDISELRRKRENKQCSRCGNALQGLRNTRHGDINSAEYGSWSSMLGRCLNPNDQAYKNYGGRGISVYEPWKTNYPAFLAHMGRKPTPLHTLDRIDNNGNYEPGNVRWATRTEQAYNKRSAVLYTYNGETLPCSEWAKRCGVTTSAMRKRFSLWDANDAATRRRWQQRAKSQFRL